MAEGFFRMVKQHADIEDTIRDYIEGWYNSDADRMEKALHPDLAKRGYRLDEATGNPSFLNVSAASMVEYTKTGSGKLDAKTDPDISIEIFSICKNIASAIVSSLAGVSKSHQQMLS